MATTVIEEGTVLTQRQLNRALLARQHLLRRREMPVGAMLQALVGMQSQVPNDPFIGLWTRLCGFRPDALSAMMRDRTAVRASLMRGTIHVVTADDYRFLQPLDAPAARARVPGDGSRPQPGRRARSGGDRGRSGVAGDGAR